MQKLINDKESKDPNVKIISLPGGQILKQYIHERGSDWRPQWNADGSICGVLMHGELYFFQNDKFDDNSFARLPARGMRAFGLSPQPSEKPRFAVFIPGNKNRPSNVLVYQLDPSRGGCTELASRSFYQADTVQMNWNMRGTGLLVLASTKTSADNYYGDQTLHCLVSGRFWDCFSVPMPRKGSIFDVAWKPTHHDKADQLFAVCYGSIPSSVGVFSPSGTLLRHFGTTGAWNEIHFNPHGNIVLLAGLGNLSGDVAVWNVDTSECLSAFKTTDVTHISWLPDGVHFVGATTTPRLRVNNGFGVWHMSGRKLLFQPVAKRDVVRPATFDLPAATHHELYQVKVVIPNELPPAPKPVKCQQRANNTGQVPVQAAYVPPHLRGKMAASGPNKQLTNVAVKANGDAEAQKKQQISYLRKKLNQIDKLKREASDGRKMDKLQIEKMAQESDLRNQLEQLTL